MSEPRLIGYARVSTAEQNLDRQLGALTALRCHTIYAEKMSGKDLRNRPQLERAINALGAGDVFVVAEWDRATRSMMDGIAIMQRIARRGAFIKVLDKPYLDLTTPIGQGILAFLSALAQDERERIIKRAHAGRKAAVARGEKMGPKFKLTAHQRALVRERIVGGDNYRKIGRDFNVSRMTILRAKNAA